MKRPVAWFLLVWFVKPVRHWTIERHQQRAIEDERAKIKELHRRLGK